MAAYMKSVPAAGLFTSVLGAQSYDVVLHGGRVMDPESGLDAVRDIAIAGRKIADAAISGAPLHIVHINSMETFVRLPEEIGWETFDLEACIPVVRR